jgi:hypothetical protein
MANYTIPSYMATFSAKTMRKFRYFVVKYVDLLCLEEIRAQILVS